ncbi:CoxG family protein [Pseudonocardia kunmingensis]|uniref:Carbon monoxide dehydrogenase subunit G n=1 Tax=Pseudonocardia kunmingensis TaxID=630975 RepID=A0A543DQ50_9PSEU|nr:SRPBCC domain-containing protein [Pseudonocardia kunmingensis]TQM11472.1 carbon monoxide dehydrogenase subunit G [Pseudonocardia kunmingensis]
MIIEHEFVVAAPREAVAAFFTDIDRVGSCVPGLEDVVRLEPDHYGALLAVRMGPIRAAFSGTLHLDAGAAPARLTAMGEGRDRATGSVATVRFTADLVEHEPGRTRVTASADVALRGRMAQYGTGVVRAAAGELVREFAACTNASLTGSTDVGTPQEAGSPQRGSASTRVPAAAPAAARRPTGLLTLLLRGMVRSARRRLTAAVTAVRSVGSRGGRR